MQPVQKINGRGIAQWLVLDRPGIEFREMFSSEPDRQAPVLLNGTGVLSGKGEMVGSWVMKLTEVNSEWSYNSCPFVV